MDAFFPTAEAFGGLDAFSSTQDASAFIVDVRGPDPLTPPFVVRTDTFGAITVPPAIAQPGQAAGDPVLTTLLSFLQAFLVTDKNLTGAWAPLFGVAPPVKTTWPHNPREVAFSTAQLPALYLWRENGRYERLADDWYREIATLKGLWVYPEALPDNQRRRDPFVSAFTKAVFVALERERTPGFVVANDPDPLTRTYGSNYGTAANLEHLHFSDWKVARLVIPSADGGKRDEYPAVELTFEVAEKLDYGQDRFAAMSPDAGAVITLLNDVGLPIVSGSA